MNATSILIVNMNYLGDALMTTPAIRAIKQSVQNAKIDVIAGSTANYGALEILALDPDIDHLIPRINGGSIARGKQLYNVIRAGNYDYVVILPTLPFYSFIAKLSGRRVLMVPKADEMKHMADHMLDSLTSLLPNISGPRSFVVKVPERATQKVEAVLAQLDPIRKLVALNVGASRPQKRWPAVHFARAAELILEAGLNVVLLGGENDQDLLTASTAMAAVNKQLSDSGDRVIDLVGKTSLEDLSAVIDAADVLVTCDTGAMHIASGLGTPQVALFGSTSAQFTGPYGSRDKTRIIDLGLACAPCGTHPTCNGRFECMSGIMPELVLESILQLMSIPKEAATC